MTDVFYPDRAQFQGKTSLKGALAVCARATEGDWLTDTCYAFNKAGAAKEGSFLFAYHFTEDGSSAAAQAQHLHSVVGKTPSMLDLEPIVAKGSTPAVAAADPGGDGHYCGQAWTELLAWHSAQAAGPWSAPDFVPAEVAAAANYISKPGIKLACAIIDAHRKLGGIMNVLYLPHWYWQVLGSPSLQPFIDRHMILVSSDYTAYSDKGPGWQPYGGMTPTVWQYSDSVNFNGAATDFNAYRGHAATVAGAVTELKSLVETGHLPHAAAKPTRHVADGSKSLDEAVGGKVQDAVRVSFAHMTAANKLKMALYLAWPGRHAKMEPGFVYWL